MLWSLLVTACFSEPPAATTTVTSDAVTSGGATAPAETADSAETAGTSGADGTTSGGLATGTSATGGTSAPADSSSGGSSTGRLPEVLFDLYNDACVGQWEVSDDRTVFVPAACGLLPTDPNEAGGAWRFPTLLTMMGEQDDVLVLQPPPLDAAVVRGTFSAADAVPEQGAVLEFEFAFVNVIPGADDVGTMTFHVYVERPDGLTADLLLERALGDGTTGVVDIPLDPIIFGDLDDIVFSVRGDTYVEGQAVALWGARVVAG